MIEKVKRLYRYIFRNQPKFNYSVKIKSERHGNDYGGWNIKNDSLNPASIVYSFGIGNDISFDTSIIKKYDCKVYAFDPTPGIKDWVENQENTENIIFESVGLSNQNGTITFFKPQVENHISHTAFDLGNSKKIEVPCLKLSSVMENLNHNKIDLLKMDIEGFEYDVLSNILFEKLNIVQLIVEFHHFFPNVDNSQTEKAIELLEKEGFRLFYVSNSFCEYSFVNEKYL